jgi:enterochelin esterase family protein
MQKAFEFASRTADARKDAGPRYDVKHEWGDGAHSDDHLGALLPDVLRWLFREGR